MLQEQKLAGVGKGNGGLPKLHGEGERGGREKGDQGMRQIEKEKREREKEVLYVMYVRMYMC